MSGKNYFYIISNTVSTTLELKLCLCKKEKRDNSEKKPIIQSIWSDSELKYTNNKREF